MAVGSSKRPLAFKVAEPADREPEQPLRVADNDLAVRVYARALAGMQKEALVRYGPTGALWKLTCDEGPYLNGTDLAPFPLAFFTAGLAFSILSELVALLTQRGVACAGLEMIQDNRYTMTGSAISGTMSGGALPVDLQVRLQPGGDPAVLRETIFQAVSASPACGLLREALHNEFTLTLNGGRVPTARVADRAGEPMPEPADLLFDWAAPADSGNGAPEIVQKLESAEAVFGVEGGAGSSLATEQKRRLHVRGVCRLRDDGTKELTAQLLSPIGSVFRFVSDDSARFGGRETAPSGLAFLSAGIAFCYLTQLGRYAHIVNKPLADYRLVQDTCFSAPGITGGTRVPGSARSVQTDVYVHTGEAAEYGQRLVDMGEQTCFLHAACREVVKVKVRV